jgi:hypothetical protein
MLAIVAVASAAGSASLRSLPRVLMRVRPSRKCASQRSRPDAIAARASGSSRGVHLQSAETRTVSNAIEAAFRSVVS